MSYNIRNPEVWFMTTVDEKNSAGIYRMRMLPGQVINDGTTTVLIDPTLNVKSSSDPRQTNPVGTIFATKSLRIAKSSVGGLFYDAGTSIISMARGTTKELEDAYTIYRSKCEEILDEFSSTATKPSSAAPTPKVVGKTKIEKLLEQFPVPSVSDHGFYVNPDNWRQILFNLSAGFNTMLIGESGTGKTELTMLLATTMMKEIKIFDMGAKQDPIASLIGVHRFDGKSVFDYADFTQWIQKDAIVVLDELPRAPLNAANILLPVLDSRKELTMDIASSDLRSIPVNPLCRFIATANEGYRYTGNSVMDLALKERFKVVNIDFIPQEQEIDLVTRRTGCSFRQAEVIVKVANQIRELASKDEVSLAVSTRHTLYAGALAEAGWAISKALEDAFLPIYRAVNEDREKIMDLLTAR